jgi:HlyD family secretion protein
VQNAETALDQAKLAYEQAQQAERTGIAGAEAQVTTAQASLDQLLAGTDADQLAGARAQVAQAQASLAKLLGDQRGGSVDAAEANVASAQANLAKLKTDPRASDLAVAKATIQSAEVSLKEANLALDKATLVAPIAGTVAEINLKVGEQPGAAGAVVVLADFSAWQIETKDLTELSVVRIKQGDAAKISFDALPGVELAGVVSRIKAIGKNSQGDIVYTVVVAPQQADARLRWNMTATVKIAAR